MKRTLPLILSFFTIIAHAQVTRKVIVEHFTNTYCSICASRNPGFYNNMGQYPEVLHIAYYPSAPYPACPLNHHNKPEADARTNFYSVYGGTPRIVIQGAVIPSSASYADPSLFTSQLGQTTPFELKVILTATSLTTCQVRVVVKKVAASSLASMTLYGAIVEDTLAFTANNGETKHYDVFRKAVWGSSPISIAAPVAVGDSVEQVQTLPFHSAWNTGRIYAIAMLQDGTKAVIQAERSGHISSATSVGTMPMGINIFPDPATDMLSVAGLPAGQYHVTITDIRGVVIKNELLSGNIDISALRPGMYMLRLTGGDNTCTTRFVKQ